MVPIWLNALSCLEYFLEVYIYVYIFPKFFDYFYVNLKMQYPFFKVNRNAILLNTLLLHTDP